MIKMDTYKPGVATSSVSPSPLPTGAGFRSQPGAPERAASQHQAITVPFPKPAGQNKIQACTEKPDEPIHDYHIRLHIVFKENSSFRC